MGSGTHPHISIVLPTRNRAVLLSRAVESVLKQTFSNYELLIIDDASTDSTSEVIASLKDNRIRVIRNDTQRHVAWSRNRGIRESKGELIAFLDDDDEFLPDFLHTAVHLHRQNHTIGFSWSAVERVTERNGRVLRRGVSHWRPDETRLPTPVSILLKRRIGIGFGVVVKREAIRTVGDFCVEMRRSEDTDLLVRLAQSFSYDVIDRPLVRIWLHDAGRLTQNPTASLSGNLMLLKRHADLVENYRCVHGDLHYRIGMQYGQLGNRRSAIRHCGLALKRNLLHLPALMGLFIYGLFGNAAPPLHRALSRIRKRQKRRWQ